MQTSQVFTQWVAYYYMFYLHAVAKGDTVECRVSKQNLIHHLPPVLILQMKRFNIGFYNVTKDGRHVSFPLVLDMAPYCTSDCIQVSRTVGCMCVRVCVRACVCVCVCVRACVHERETDRQRLCITNVILYCIA